MAPEVVVDIHINDGGFSRVPRELLVRAVEIVLDSEGVDEGELSVTLMDDQGIRGLNQEYLDRDYVTDVIAFTLSGDGEALMGDVYIGFEQAMRQANQMGIDRSRELARLAIHGVLHVLGHDHPEGEERTDSPLWVLQEDLVTRLLDADN